VKLGDRPSRLMVVAVGVKPANWLSCTAPVASGCARNTSDTLRKPCDLISSAVIVVTGDAVSSWVRGMRDPEERLRELVVRHACIATHGRGAVAQLVDEVRALPAANRKVLEERMRLYFDLVRDTLKQLRALGRLRNVDPTVATFGLIGTILWLPRWFRQNGRLTQEQVAHQIADIALGGLLKAPETPKRKRRPARQRRAALEGRRKRRAKRR